MQVGAGTNAVVTGGASGIGLSVARLLAARGARVVASDVNEEALAAAVGAAKDEGLDLVGLPADVSSFASMTDLAATVDDQVGPVHVLHLNAGIAGMLSLLEGDDPGPWERIVGINLLGVVWGIKSFAPAMVAHGDEGFIVATSSGAGAEGTAYQQPGYAATKNAVVSLIESLYGQLRDAESKIRAGILLPPLTATNLAGDPSIMAHVETFLRNKGVPASVVQPDQVAELLVDGIERGRFFIRAGNEQNDIFDGSITDEFLEWNEAVIRGRAEVELADAQPDRYLW